MKDRSENWKPHWVALPILDFARAIREFGDDYKNGFDWVRNFSDDLLFGNFDTPDEFTRQLLAEARERFVKRSNAGKLGGRPPKDGTQRCKPPRDKQEVLDFASDSGLDVDDARTWYERNFVERPGCDKYGEVIRNWKGALVAACKADRERREEENEDDDRF